MRVDIYTSTLKIAQYAQWALLTHMRSWVMGKLPSAAARWRGVRASLGLTHEFTWIAILVAAFQKCHIGNLHHSIAHSRHVLWLPSLPLPEMSEPVQGTRQQCHTWGQQFKFAIFEHIMRISGIKILNSPQISVSIPAYCINQGLCWRVRCW